VQYWSNQGQPRRRIVALHHAYHGDTVGAMSVSEDSIFTRAFSPLMFGVDRVDPPYCYRCPLGLTYPSCDVKCATDTKDLIEYETSGEVAVFIGECIQGVGGTIVPPPEYFEIADDIINKHGGLCIADEVQTGFGRTGNKYWGFQNWDVMPDMVTMAKGIGNGVPIAAGVTTPRNREPR